MIFYSIALYLRNNGFRSYYTSYVSAYLFNRRNESLAASCIACMLLLACYSFCQLVSDITLYGLDICVARPVFPSRLLFYGPMPHLHYVFYPARSLRSSYYCGASPFSFCFSPLVIYIKV